MCNSKRFLKVVFCVSLTWYTQKLSVDSNLNKMHEAIKVSLRYSVRLKGQWREIFPISLHKRTFNVTEKWMVLTTLENYLDTPSCSIGQNYTFFNYVFPTYSKN